MPRRTFGEIEDFFFPFFSLNVFVCLFDYFFGCADAAAMRSRPNAPSRPTGSCVADTIQFAREQENPGSEHKAISGVGPAVMSSDPAVALTPACL